MINRRSWILGLVLALGAAGPAWAEDDDEQETETVTKPAATAAPGSQPAPVRAPKAEALKSWDATVAEKYLEGEFPAKVLEPAVARSVTRLFLSDKEGQEQAREAVQAAMSKVAKEGRAHLADMFEAIVAKDRAAYELALGSVIKTVDQRTGYWERAVEKFFPDLNARGRPLVRVGVTRGYTCSNVFLGRVMGASGKRGSMARAVRKAMTRNERREACVFVRRWAEEKAVANMEKLLGDLQKFVRGEKVELAAEQQKFADRIGIRNIRCMNAHHGVTERSVERRIFF